MPDHCPPTRTEVGATLGCCLLVIIAFIVIFGAGLWTVAGWVFGD